MADTQPAPAADGASKRPEKPDEAKYKADLAKAEKDHEAAQGRFNAIRAKLDGARPGKGSPNDRFKELVDDQKSIRQKQGEHKSAKAGQQEKFNQNDTLIKKLIGDQKDARSRVGFKSVEEIDAKIDSLSKQVDAGTMKLVDEKKALTEVSSLRRSKKGFAGLDDLQKKIDEKKAENTELKKTFDNPESRALSQKYEDNQKELDDIKAAREDTNKNFDTLKAERDKFYEEQQATYQGIRKVKDDYYTQRKAYKEFEDQIWQQKRERQKAEKDSYEKEKRKRIAEQKLEEASEPAFLEKIRTAEGLIRHFDPNFSTDEGDKGPGEFAATAQRTVNEEAGFKGMKVVKKEDEDFFVGGGGKKKGKGKKGSAAPAESGKLNMNIGIIQQLADVGVDPPSTQAEVPGVVEKLKEKLAAWKKDQDSQTQQNVDKAKKEIEKLEQEAVETSNTASSSGPTGRQNRAKKVSAKDASANGPVSAESEQIQEKDGVADATKDLAEAKLEDKENAPAETA